MTLEFSRLEYPILSAKPKLLFVGDSQPRQQQLLGELRGAFEVVQVQSPLRALSRLARESFAGLYVAAEHLGDAIQIGRLLQNERILEGMPDNLKEAFILFELEDMTVPQIAELLGIPTGTVASRLRRARALFQKCVDELRSTREGGKS